MKTLILALLVFASVAVQAQQTENLIIITTDGLRWQDLFQGMDSSIAKNRRYNQGDSGYLFKTYWADTDTARRRKLMPFFWTSIATKGQVYGNRKLGNKVNVSNRYKFSYPGYSEIFTGYADTAINSNDYPPNPHVTVLEFLNQQPKLKGSVIAFGAWDAFPRILNEGRSGVPVVAGYEKSGGKNPNARQQLLNEMLDDVYRPWHEVEVLDVFTHYAAMEELKKSKPRVLYIAYGETDEWAHAGEYRFYLDAARQVDKWIRQIWEFVQSDPQYRNKTTLFFTTDHGRGTHDANAWTSHGENVHDAEEMWFAVMGPNITPHGEMKVEMQVYQRQFAQTLAQLMGYTFKATQPVAAAIPSVLKK